MQTKCEVYLAAGEHSQGPKLAYICSLCFVHMHCIYVHLHWIRELFMHVQAS